MILEITDYFGAPVKLQPRVELYSVRDFMGREMPGLAIVLDEVMGEPDEMEPYATLTVSFGEFIGLKNSAYIDTNNCRFAQQLLDQGIAEDTGLRKSSGFCEYPLWGFKKEFLEEIGGEKRRCSAARISMMKSPTVQRMMGWLCSNLLPAKLRNEEGYY